MKTSGVLELTDASPAQTFVEPITLATIKNFLRIPDTSPADTTQDALLEAMITAAREIAEAEQGADLVSKQWDLRLYDFYDYEISLRYPLQSVELVQYKDDDAATTTLSEGTDYLVDKPSALVMPLADDTWPSFTPYDNSSVLIRFTSGYSSTHPFWSGPGKIVLQGMMQLISAWYYARMPWTVGEIGHEVPYAVTVLLRHGARPRVF